MRRLAQRHRVTVASFWDRNRTDWLLGTTLTAPLQPRSYTLDGVSVQQVTWRRDERWRLLPLLCVYYALKTQAIAVISRRLLPKLAAVAPTCDLVYHARIGRESLAFASLALARQRFDSAAGRLVQALKSNTREHGARLNRVAPRLSLAPLRAVIANERRALDVSGQRAATALARLMQFRRQRFETAAKLVDSLSYKSALRRGFVLVRDDKVHPQEGEGQGRIPGGN